MGDSVRILCTLLWLKFVATEKADFDDDDKLNEPNDEFDVPDPGRKTSFRVDVCTLFVTSVLGINCDPSEGASCVVSSIK